MKRKLDIYQYCVISTEIGNMFCYHIRGPYGAYYYQEFFTDLECRIHDGFDDDRTIEIITNNDIGVHFGMGYKYVKTREEFALALDKYISDYGSHEMAKGALLNEISKREMELSRRIRENKARMQAEANKKLTLKRKANDIINRYGIK